MNIEKIFSNKILINLKNNSKLNSKLIKIIFKFKIKVKFSILKKPNKKFINLIDRGEVPMRYFSYNDFIDCTENGEIDKVLKVEEKIARYEAKNKKTQDRIDRNIEKKITIKTFSKRIYRFL